MTKPIALFCSSPPGISVAANPAPQKATTVFHRVASVRKQVDLNPLRDPFNLVEGVIWVGLWGLSTLFSAQSMKELYTVLKAESPATEKNVKIGNAVKTAFVDLISLGG